MQVISGSFKLLQKYKLRDFEGGGVALALKRQRARGLVYKLAITHYCLWPRVRLELSPFIIHQSTLLASIGMLQF